MRLPGPGGFLGLGHTLLSFTMSPVDSVLQQLHRQARGHLAAGGTASMTDKPKPSRQVGGDFYQDVDREIRS